MKSPATLDEFYRTFPSERRCWEALRRLRWPDGFSFGPDGWLYVTCSSLHEVIGRSGAHVRSRAPYQIFRFRPGKEGIPGH